MKGEIVVEVENLQELLKDYKQTIIEMTNAQTRYDKEKDEETIKILNLSKYIVSNLETKIIDMYISKWYICNI